MAMMAVSLRERCRAAEANALASRGAASMSTTQRRRLQRIAWALSIYGPEYAVVFGRGRRRPLSGPRAFCGPHAQRKASRDLAVGR
jgi:hypothetical protein